jgi:DMSO/TMAO reductase YedYZ heme-binding membrane subunit
VTLAELLWLTSRTAALTTFFVLAAALGTGQALRTFVLEGWVGRREVMAVHSYLTVCWAPLVTLHVLAGLLDPVSRLSPLDLVIPFRVAYAALPIGLGTLGLDLLLVVGATSYLRKRMDPATWRWLHRTSYIMFVLVFVHAVLSGSDVGRPLIAAAIWATFAFVVILTVARMAIGRVTTPS